MAEEEKNLPEEEKPAKNGWQAVKESWYDKIPLTLKQLDIIIGCCFAAMAVLVVMIVLDAMGIWSPFG